ncbi:MAG TPA: hypothetical protein VGL13_17280, partial [Polyangiaceae bacterium]
MIALALRTLFLGFALLFVHRAAWAATDADKALARELGQSGIEASDAKDYPTAVDRLSRAISLYDVPTLRLARAHALRAMGRFVSASEDYHAILLRKPLSDDPAPIVQATRAAQSELPDVEAKIAHLTVVMTGGAAGLRVDGVEWPSAAVGVPSPIDPGEHSVEAFTASGPVQNQRVSLTPGQNERIELAVPTAPVEGQPQPGPAPPFAQPMAPQPGPAPAPAPSADHTAAYVTLAISGALAVGSIVTGVLALGKKSDYDAINDPSHSHAAKDDARSAAQSMALVSTVLTGAAIVGGGVSLYLFLTPGQKGSEAAPRATARATTG